MGQVENKFRLIHGEGKASSPYQPTRLLRWAVRALFREPVDPETVNDQLMLILKRAERSGYFSTEELVSINTTIHQRLDGKVEK